MKKLAFVSLLIFTSTICYSQKSQYTYYPQNTNFVSARDTSKTGRFAICTPNKDTLFISKNDSMGMLIYEIWKEDPKYKGKNPVIVLTDNITYYEKKYAYSLANKSKSIKN